MKFNGIYTPAVTPYTNEGKIDEIVFRQVIEYLLDANVHGIIIGGSTGEYFTQSLEERYLLGRLAKEVIGNKIPLLMGTGGTRTDEAIAQAKMAKEIKADGILVGTPPYALPTQAENASHALAIDKAADLPIMLYNYPGRMGVKMEKEFFDIVLKNSKNFQSIKESAGDTADLHQLAIKYPELQLSCGWDDQALEFFAWGATSWVCAGSNFLPKEHIALYEACVIEKDFDKGRKIMTAMMPLMDFLENAGKFVQTIKYGISLEGLAVGSTRAPLHDLSEAQQLDFKSIVDEVKKGVAAAL
ncbi:dihydrodipicolinate synthase family protein [Ignatzschineria rhizosphaerae]|uniref:Dihydrodipicolinate synthase family protein n=1 Tax=Ignatzschineria rhizosphaerae TaxID=2923279 RepID=A0ABY3X1K5_9GAMM|nr:dihydrodipicolinate synthase family protein [Ignatzschineria rhizosphaerae]UNM96763.1 dihydrodipicolinate synthase family protein [Ignatzschineria rhizosphaerae]